VESEKSKTEGAATVKDKNVIWVAPPPEALIVTETGPVAAIAVAENDTVTGQVGLHGLLVKIAVTPAGNPDAEKVTGAVVPLTRVAVIEEDELVEP
jgi:hypothetical protein